MDMYIQPNMVTILARYLLRDPWMTTSRTSPKLYHKCMKKIRTDHAHINYIKYVYIKSLSKVTSVIQINVGFDIIADFACNYKISIILSTQYGQ